MLCLAQLGRPGLLSPQKAEAWEQWKRGQSLSDIGWALGKHAGSIHGIIADKLSLEWSPKLIAGWLKRQFLTEPQMRVSHETIYRILFIQA
ncbi:MAG: hypothetical protein KC588_01850 [Nitrospira sp.]|nr:hypothetical protein [Nitrospira sp.]